MAQFKHEKMWFHHHHLNAPRPGPYRSSTTAQCHLPNTKDHPVVVIVYLLNMMVVMRAIEKKKGGLCDLSQINHSHCHTIHQSV